MRLVPILDLEFYMVTSNWCSSFCSVLFDYSQKFYCDLYKFQHKLTTNKLLFTEGYISFQDVLLKYIRDFIFPTTLNHSFQRFRYLSMLLPD